MDGIDLGQQLPPAAVSATRRLVRWTRVWPSLGSSSRRLWLTRDRVTPSPSAARPKWSSRAMARKTRISRSSMVSHID